MIAHRLHIVVALGIRNVARNWRRSALTASAVAVAILSANFLAAISEGVSEQMIRDAIDNFIGHVRVHKASYLDDLSIEHAFAAQGLLAQVESRSISAKTVRIRVPAIIRSERHSYAVHLLGVIPEAERGMSFVPKSIAEGDFLEDAQDRGLVIGWRLAQKLQTQIGRRVVLASQGVGGEVAERGFRVRGLYEAELEAVETAYAIGGLETVQGMLGAEGMVTEAAFRGEDRHSTALLAKLISKKLPELEVKTWRDLDPLVVTILKVQGGVLLIWNTIVATAVAFGLANTMFMSVFERVREFALYQALGMRRAEIVLQVIVESMGLIVIGVLVGDLLSAGVMYWLRDGIDLGSFADATQMYGTANVVFPALRLKSSMLTNAVVLGIGMISSLYPAWRASRFSPADAFVHIGRGG